MSGRKTIPTKDWKILIAESGGYCAYPDCPEYLVADGTDVDDAVFLGEIAHIVGSSRQGPRGDSGLTDEDRNKHTNLLLLCDKHHKVIDGQVHQYSIPVLLQMKADQRLSNKPREEKSQALNLLEDKIFSTILPLTHVPQTVFVAPSKFKANEREKIRGAILWPKNQDELAPYLIHGSELYSFHDLRAKKNPFAKCVNQKKVELMKSQELWELAEGQWIFIRLLNSSLFKYCSRLNIKYDPNHTRFYFPVEEAGIERSESYKPMNVSSSSLKVAWNPKTKATGKGKRYWLHRAAKLKFHKVGPKNWILTIRPERHVTTDGITLMPPEKIGPVVTRQKAKMYNEGYLTEVHFWKDFLSKSRPRLILDFGLQSVVVSTALQTFDITWPGIDGDDKPYKNQELEDDLFSLADFERAISGLPPEDYDAYQDDFEEEEEDDGFDE